MYVHHRVCAQVHRKPHSIAVVQYAKSGVVTVSYGELWSLVLNAAQQLAELVHSIHSHTGTLNVDDDESATERTESCDNRIDRSAGSCIDETHKSTLYGACTDDPIESGYSYIHSNACNHTDNVRVGLAMHEDINTLIVCLAVLCIGGVIVPLVADDPGTRLRHMCATADVQLIVTSSDMQDVEDRQFDGLQRWAGEDVKIVSVRSVVRTQLHAGEHRTYMCGSIQTAQTAQSPQHVGTNHSKGNCWGSIDFNGVCKTPDRLSHVIFTSGTTGPPKGVLGTHRNLNAYTDAKVQAFGVSRGDRVLVGSTLTFDPCLTDMLSTLSVGATLCLLAERSYLTEDLADALQQTKATHILTTPAIWSLVPTSACDTYLPNLKTIALGGDAMSVAMATAWAVRGRRLINTYGVTEATAYQTFHVYGDRDVNTEGVGGKWPGTTTEIPAGTARYQDILACIGRPLPGVVLRLRRVPDETHNDNETESRIDHRHTPPAIHQDTHVHPDTQSRTHTDVRTGTHQREGVDPLIDLIPPQEALVVGEICLGGDQVALGYAQASSAADLSHSPGQCNAGASGPELRTGLPSPKTDYMVSIEVGEGSLEGRECAQVNATATRAHLVYPFFYAEAEADSTASIASDLDTRTQPSTHLRHTTYTKAPAHLKANTRSTPAVRTDKAPGATAVEKEKAVLACVSVADTLEEVQHRPNSGVETGLQDGTNTTAENISQPTVRGAVGTKRKRVRMYATGDLAHYDHHGNLCLVGRQDHQVKINGMRLALAEVEYYVKVCGLVQDAICVTMPRHCLSAFDSSAEVTTKETMCCHTQSGTAKDPDVVLVCFVVLRDSITHPRHIALTARAIGAHCSTTMPKYMRPRVRVMSTQKGTTWPLTANGKVDRTALQQSVCTRYNAINGSSLADRLLAPRSPWQRPIPPTTGHPAGDTSLRGGGVAALVRKIWCNVLGVQPGDVIDSTYLWQIGGDSLTGLRICRLLFRMYHEVPAPKSESGAKNLNNNPKPQREIGNSGTVDAENSRDTTDGDAQVLGVNGHNSHVKSRSACGTTNISNTNEMTTGSDTIHQNDPDGDVSTSIVKEVSTVNGSRQPPELPTAVPTDVPPAMVLSDPFGHIPGPFAPKYLVQNPNFSEYVDFLRSQGVSMDDDKVVNESATPANVQQPKPDSTTQPTSVSYEDHELNGLVTEAAKCGYADVVRSALHSGACVDGQWTRKTAVNTPLHLAVMNIHPECVRVLLENGARTALLNGPGMTPLHYTASKANAMDADTTANPNPNPNPDKPSQSDAAQQLEIIDLLVEFGVDLRTRTKNRQTIMHVAARVGHSQMIRHIAALVRRIVPPPPRNKVKQAKREGVTVQPSSEAEHPLERVLSGLDRWRRTPLHWSVLNGHIEATKILLDLGSNTNRKINVRAKSTHLPPENVYDIALRTFGQGELTELLLAFGAEPLDLHRVEQSSRYVQEMRAAKTARSKESQ